MKKILLTALLLPLGINAQVFNPDPNLANYSTYFSDFQKDTCGVGNLSAIKIERPTGTGNVTGKSWKITSPTNGRRAELAFMKGFTHKMKQDFYYAWRWRVNASPNVNKPVTVFQWKTRNGGQSNEDGSQNYPLNMEYYNGKLVLFYFKPCVIDKKFRNWGDCKKKNKAGKLVQEYPSDRAVKLKEISVAENEWVEIVLRVKKGTTASGTGEGKVQLWINGTLQSLDGPNGTGTSITARTDDARVIEKDSSNFVPQYGDAEVYPKWGIYNTASCDFNITTWTHNLKVYDNHTDALESLKNSRPSSSSKNGALLKDTDIALTKRINVYPNPASGTFKIDLKGFKKTNIKVSNLLGKTVYKTTTESNSIKLNKGNSFKSGMYIITAKDEHNHSYTSKLLIK